VRDCPPRPPLSISPVCPNLVCMGFVILLLLTKSLALERVRSLSLSLSLSLTHAMGRLRFVGSLKVYVSFAEYSLIYRALLQKRPKILRSLLIVATP